MWVRRATNFTELLQPLGLVEKYGAAFGASRIPFEVSARLFVTSIHASSGAGFAARIHERLHKLRQGRVTLISNRSFSSPVHLAFFAACGCPVCGGIVTTN